VKHSALLHWELCVSVKLAVAPLQCYRDCLNASLPGVRSGLRTDACTSSWGAASFQQALVC